MKFELTEYLFAFTIFAVLHGRSDCASVSSAALNDGQVSHARRSHSHTRHACTAGGMTADGSLHLSVLSRPVLDSFSQQFALVLTCGNFTSLSRPPFDVVWTTPEGNTLPSSAYAEGFFQLRLSNPVTGGTYSCRVLPTTTAGAAACLPTPSDVTVNVDEMAARLSLLEANQAAVQKVDREQKELLAQQNRLIQDLETSQTAMKEVVRQQAALLAHQNHHIHILDQHLHDIATRQVSFLAKLFQHRGNTAKPSPGAPVVFKHVLNNLGDAYDYSTGLFTAPYAGSYFFAVTTRCGDPDRLYGDAKIMSDNHDHEVCRVDSNVHQDAGSCQGVVHLGSGQRAWVSPINDDDCYDGYATVFTGFLISADP